MQAYRHTYIVNDWKLKSYSSVVRRHSNKNTIERLCSHNDPRSWIWKIFVAYFMKYHVLSSTSTVNFIPELRSFTKSVVDCPNIPSWVSITCDKLKSITASIQGQITNTTIDMFTVLFWFSECSATLKGLMPTSKINRAKLKLTSVELTSFAHHADYTIIPQSSCYD